MKIQRTDYLFEQMLDLLNYMIERTIGTGVATF